jgi:hypothetical protein
MGMVNFSFLVNFFNAKKEILLWKLYLKPYLLSLTRELDKHEFRANSI